MFQLKDVSLRGLKQVSYVSLTYKVAFACFKGEFLELYLLKFTNLIKILNFKLTYNGKKNLSRLLLMLYITVVFQGFLNVIRHQVKHDIFLKIFTLVMGTQNLLLICVSRIEMANKWFGNGIAKNWLIKF